MAFDSRPFHQTNLVNNLSQPSPRDKEIQGRSSSARAEGTASGRCSKCPPPQHAGEATTIDLGGAALEVRTHQRHAVRPLPIHRACNLAHDGPIRLFGALPINEIGTASQEGPVPWRLTHCGHSTGVFNDMAADRGVSEAHAFASKDTNPTAGPTANAKLGGGHDRLPPIAAGPVGSTLKLVVQYPGLLGEH